MTQGTEKSKDLKVEKDQVPGGDEADAWALSTTMADAQRSHLHGGGGPPGGAPPSSRSGGASLGQVG